MADEIELADDKSEAEKLQEAYHKLIRRASDLKYMVQAYRELLGPNALELAKRWDSIGVQRFHVSWGEKAHLMTGEERAKVLLDMLDRTEGKRKEAIQ